MKAKWIITGAAVLVVAGAMPWAVGYVTEQQWQQVTHELNRTQPFLQLQTEVYQRGFFGAELSGVVTVLNPESGESHPVDYQADVTHGITGSFIDFRPAQGWAPEGSDWFRERPRLTLETRLWGTAALELEAPAIAVDNPETGESLRTSGGVARIEVSDAGSRVEALLVWPQISFSGPEASIRIDDFRVEQDMAHLNGDVWTGNMEAFVANVSLSAPGAPPVIMEELQAGSSTEASDNGQRLNSRLSVEAGKVRFEDKAYGPHKLTFALENLSVASWGRLASSMAELQSLALAQDTANREAFEQQMTAMEEVNTAMRDLAAAGFSVGLPELSLDTPEGRVTGNVTLSHPELTGAQKTEMLLIMQAITGKMNLSVPTALAEDYPAVRMQLAPLIKQGLLVQKGEKLTLAATLNDMTINVNGQEIPLPPLL